MDGGGPGRPLYVARGLVYVIERDDGRSFRLMHAERGPSGGTGRKYYDNYCLLVRQIIVFIYRGQAPRSQISRAEHPLLCFIKVANKETDCCRGCGLRPSKGTWLNK